MKKYEKLEKSHLLELYKEEIIPFLGALEEEHPGYNYDEMEELLSNIELKKGKVEDGYIAFDASSKTLILDTEEIVKMGLCPRHVIHQGLLDACTKKEQVEEKGKQQFFKGINKMIVLALPSPDNDRMQTDALQYTLLSSFSKIVEPEILVKSFMKNDLSPVVIRLGELGINANFFALFLETLEKMDDPTIQDNRAYGDAQLQLINMFESKLIRQLSTGELRPGKKVQVLLDDFGERILLDSNVDETTLMLNEFGATFIKGKGELNSVYPQYNFSEIRLNAEDKKGAWAKARESIQNLNEELSMYGPFQQEEAKPFGKSRTA